MDRLLDLLVRLSVGLLAFPFVFLLGLCLPSRKFCLFLCPILGGQFSAQVKFIQSRRADKIGKRLTAVPLGFQLGGNMPIHDLLNIVGLVCGGAAETPDRFALGLQCLGDLHGIGLLGLVELVEMRSAFFFAPI